MTLKRHEPSYKQPKVMTNRTSCLCGNRNGYHNTELRTQKHIIGQHKKPFFLNEQHGSHQETGMN